MQPIEKKNIDFTKIDFAPAINDLRDDLYIAQLRALRELRANEFIVKTRQLKPMTWREFLAVAKGVE